jgi:hypothetical protein
MLVMFVDMTVFVVRLFFYSSVLQLYALNANEAPRIQTDIGQFEGKVLDFGGKGQVHAFYGLPFAQPPKRFEVSLLHTS